MLTIVTHQGRRIEIILQAELCDPVTVGEFVRAYCHIHGSDHQRSLSINKMTGWGHCFNAMCDATVLVVEWNRDAARRLIQMYYRGLPDESLFSYRPPARKKVAGLRQPVLLHPTKAVPQWQQEELESLQLLEKEMRKALVSSSRARAYLRERGIPLEVAYKQRIGYLTPEMIDVPELQRQRGMLFRWTERILFPLVSPAGRGYIGRSLWHWHPGMNEHAHKSLLDQPGKPRRWIKTNPAGWFAMELEQLARTIILVEGAFDRLALLAAGLRAEEVVALAGTAAQPDWIPAQVRALVLALDGDEGGMEATNRLVEQLTEAGLCVRICSPDQGRWGKDWNERWRHMGPESVEPILETYAELRSA